MSFATLQTLPMQIKAQLTPQSFSPMNNFPLGITLANWQVFFFFVSFHNYTYTVSTVYLWYIPVKKEELLTSLSTIKSLSTFSNMLITTQYLKYASVHTAWPKDKARLLCWVFQIITRQRSCKPGEEKNVTTAEH